MGIMEVKLVDAKDLKNTEFLGGIDPYVVIQFESQEHKSSVAKGQGSNPVWNEKFTFKVEFPGEEDDEYKLILKIMDKDNFSADDYLGQATIYLKEVFELGVECGSAEIQPRKYNVVYSDQSYQGEIEVGITFDPKVQEDTRGGDIGGWKESEYH